MLENFYETDLSKPSFDRVTSQNYGGENYSFAYYSIDDGVITPGLAAPDAALVDAASSTNLICPSACAGARAKPPAVGSETWIATVEAGYMVFPDANASPMAASLANKAGTWAGLPAWAFVELQSSGAKTAMSHPRVPWPAEGVVIQTSAGTINLRPTANPGEVGWTAAEANASNKLFGGGWSSLILGKAGTWRAYPGRAVGAVRVRQGAACPDSFVVTSDGNSLGFPGQSCGGLVEFQELGRRGELPWSSFLTSPHGATAYHFGWDSVLPLSATWRSAPWDRGTMDCAPDIQLEGPEPTCAAVPTTLLDGFPKPDCRVPMFRRSRDLPTPSDRAAFSCLPGSPADMLPSLPNSCKEFDDFAAAAPNAAPSVENIRGASVVRTGGYTRVYYADAEGRIVQVKNYDAAAGRFGARVEYNFDLDGRLIGELEPTGARRCIQYDRDSNAIRVAHLPAPGAGASVEERTLFAPFGRPSVTYDPSLRAPTPLRSYGWNAAGNLTSVSVPDPVRGTLTTLFYPRTDGRLDHSISPGGLVTVFAYDATSLKPTTTTLFAQTTANAWDTTKPLRSTSVVLDSWWQPTSVTDTLGPTRTFSWLGLGRLLSATTQLDSTLASVSEAYSYDASGRIRLVDGPDLDVETQWSPQGLPIFRMEFSASEQHRHCLNYAAGRPVAAVDPEGRWVRGYYDANGDLTRVTAGIDSFGGSTALSGCGNLVADGAPAGMETVLVLDRDLATGLITRKSVAPDSVGTLPSGSSRDAQTESYQYDGFGRRIATIYPTGVVDKVGYDALGRVAWTATFSPSSGTNTPSPAALASGPPSIALAGTSLTIDPSLERYTQYTYDPQSRVLSESALWFYRNGATVVVEGTGWHTTTNRYDDVARTLRVTDPTGRSTTYSLDELGRPSMVVLPDGTSTERYTYTNGGLTVRKEVTSGAVPGGLLVETSNYLQAGQLKSRADGAGRPFESLSYDAYGRAVDTVAPSLTTRSFYNPFGQVTRVARLKAGTPVDLQWMTYTRTGLLKTLTDGNGATTSWAYDRGNRPYRTTLPDLSTTNTSYFAGTGLADSVTDRSGVATRLGYDAYGQLKFAAGTRSDSEQRDTRSEWVRGPLGVLSNHSYTMVKGRPLTEDIQRTYTLDSLGRTIREGSTLFPGNTLVFERDGYGRATRLQTAGNDLSRTFEAGLGRLDTIKLGARTLADYNYSSGVGSPASVVYGNGLTETRTYDIRGRRRTSTVLNAAAATVLGTDLNYGDNELLARADQWYGTSPRQSILLRSDEYGRLAKDGRRAGLAAATSPMSNATIDSQLVGATSLEAHAFDAIDNITARTIGTAAPVNPTFGTDQRLTNWGGVVGSDADGRVTGIPAGASLRYDGLGRVFSATLPSGTVMTFAYDADNRLSGWNLGRADALTFEFADGAIVRERSAGVDTLYVPGDDLGPVVTRVGTVETTNLYTFGTRLVGATNGSGALVERYDYSAYGAPTISNAAGTAIAATAVGNRLLLTGQPWIPGLAAYSQGARLYRPDWGRFLTADPIGFGGGTNRYVYGMASPHVFIDPLGLTGTPWPGISTGFGGIHSSDLLGALGLPPPGTDMATYGYYVMPPEAFWSNRTWVDSAPQDARDWQKTQAVVELTQTLFDLVGSTALGAALVGQPRVVAGARGREVEPSGVPNEEPPRSAAVPPSTGPLKNRSGSLQESAGKARTLHPGEPALRPATEQLRGGSGLVLRDAAGATPAEVAASKAGPTSGSRLGQSKVRQNLLDQIAPGQPYVCWRCGQTSMNASDMHLGHRNVPTSDGGNLEPVNVCLEGAACNLSAGNRGAPSSGMSCAERGSCGAPYGR
ncbi:MAG: RHS repeat-associated core domain-containing protein [Myxococcota bacterium]